MCGAGVCRSGDSEGPNFTVHDTELLSLSDFASIVDWLLGLGRRLFLRFWQNAAAGFVAKKMRGTED